MITAKPSAWCASEPQTRKMPQAILSGATSIKCTLSTSQTSTAREQAVLAKNRRSMQRTLTPFLAGLVAAIVAVPALAQTPTFTLSNNMLGGAGFNSAPGCMVDMNGDFLDDVVRIMNGSVCIDYQNANGTYTHQQYMMPSASSLWSIAAGDINQDGYTDLLMGDGSFVEFLIYDSTMQDFVSDYHPEYIFSQRSTFADINNDGHLDAFVCHDVDGSHPYRNDGSGNLVLDYNLIQTVNLRGNYSAIWTDFDNDHDIDLYITKCAGGATLGDPERVNGLYQNDGLGNYTEMAASVNMADEDQSWCTVFQDFDNDGDFDAFTVNHEIANRFMLNDGTGNFTDIIDQTGINKTDLGAWELIAHDFNNDGWVDILSEMQDRLYINNGDLTFTAESVDFDEGGIGDFNNDGFLDVFDGNDLYINDGNQNNWLKVELQGTASNSSAIGARIELYGSWGTQMREVRSGTSFSTMSSLNSYFGLGTDTQVDSMMVRWPSGIVQWRFDVDANQTLYIEEGNNPAPIGITEWRAYGGMQVYPNPASELVTIQLDEAVADAGNAVVTVFDLSGAVVAQERYSMGNNMQVNVKDFAPGAYLIQVKAGNNPVYTNRLMVE